MDDPVFGTHLIGELPAGPVTAGIRASIEGAIAAIVPPARSGAFVAVVTNDGTLRGAIATRLGKDWMLAADVDRTWGGEVSGKVLLMGSW